MHTANNFISSLMFVVITALAAPAQQDRSSFSAQPAAVTVTVAAAGDRVRFTAPSSIVQVRLEVYNSAGRKLFDNELRTGNVLDWNLQDGQGQRLANDSYLCVVTVKSLSGRLTQRIGSVIIEKDVVRVQVVTTRLTAQQIEAVGPVEENSFLSVLGDIEPPTTTVIAHNGEEGQIVRGKGALSFRIGDFLRGRDTEQMRLTPEGNLGIGIIHPEVRLDVDGLIRATRGIAFPDGSVQFSAARKTFGAASLGPGQSLSKLALADGQEHLSASPSTSGTGTTGKITKWLDGPAGVLDDSNIAEVSGAIGINGTPDTRFRLDVNGSTRIRGSNPGFNLEGLRSAGNIWLFQTVDDDGRFRLFGQDNVNPGVERFTINLSSGNVGIGATNPLFKLHVQGGGIVETQVKSTDERAILSLDSTLSGQNRVWTLENGVFGTPGLFSIFDRSALQARLIITTEGRVGIGSTTPLAKLEVQSSGSLPAVLGNSQSGNGLQGVSTSGDGLHGESSSGKGVFGHSDSSYGVHGVGNVGVRGESSGGTGVYGEGNVGVNGVSAGGTAVHGLSASGVGVQGVSSSSYGTIGASGSGTGVHAQSTSGNLIDASNGSGIKFKVENNGNVHAPAYLGLPDFAEAILPSAVDKSRLQPGDVLVTASNTDRSVSKSRKAYSTSVLGVYSTAPGFVGTERPIEGASSDTIPMAVIGIVPCKVSAENGPIRRGDLLTTSSTPGHAMRCANRIKCTGAVVGKALSSLDKGTALIPVLVTLQ